MSFVAGIDVSHWQGNIDWTRVSATEVEFAFIKASQGTNHVDPMWATNAAGASAAGLPFGGYHFATPKAGTAAAEAAHFVDQLTGEETLRPVLDLERGDHLAPAELTRWALEWLTEVARQVGTRPTVYVGFFFAQENLVASETRLASYPLWLPWYERQTEPPAPKPWHDWHVWQHTDEGQVDGVTGNVDQNRARPELIDELRHGSVLGSQGVLRRGSTGPAIEEIQRLLRAAGIDIGTFGPDGDGVDGDYGAATERGVTALQAGLGLTQTGVWDDAVRRALTS